MKNPGSKDPHFCPLNVGDPSSLCAHRGLTHINPINIECVWILNIKSSCKQIAIGSQADTEVAVTLPLCVNIGRGDRSKG